jgi:urease accessory protein
MGDVAVLRLLQLADSGFPSGAYTLSHGLETLIGDGLVADADELAAFARTLLVEKFGRSDLIAVVAVHRAAAGADGLLDRSEALDTIVAIDQRLTAAKLAADDRIGSARVGRRIAVEVDRLEPSPLLGDFIEATDRNRTPGNAAVAFGLAGQVLGVDARSTALGASSALVNGIAAAAIRLGLVGHGAGQRLIGSAGPSISHAVDGAMTADWRNLRPSAPQIDAAAGRHEVAVARQFAS